MDFLNHLLDAPLSNILIVAGLLFLGVAAVGKITGKIEPDKPGRIMSGLLGGALLIAGISTHITSDSRSDQAKAGQSNAIQPVIHAFSVTPAHITKGGKVKIYWDVLNADKVELEPFGLVNAVGSTVDEPQQTTVYRLRATNASGGNQSTSQEVFVSSRSQADNGKAQLPSRTSPTPRDTDSGDPSGSVPNFAGTWTMKGWSHNGVPQPMGQGRDRAIITQNGALVHFGKMELSVGRDGRATQKSFAAEGYENGHPLARQVQTESEAAFVRNMTLWFEGATLVEEIKVTYKGPYFGHPLGTDVHMYRWMRAE